MLLMYVAWRPIGRGRRAVCIKDCYAIKASWENHLLNADKIITAALLLSYGNVMMKSGLRLNSV